MKKLSIAVLSAALMVFPVKASAQEITTEGEDNGVSVVQQEEDSAVEITKKEKAKKEKKVKVVKEKKEKKKASYGLFNHLGIGAGVAVTDGLSFTAGLPLGGHLAVRGTYSVGVPDAIYALSFTRDFGSYKFKDGVTDREVNLDNLTAKAVITPNINAFVDLYPSKKNSFHFTVGLVGITANTLASVSADLHDPLYQRFPEKEGQYNTLFVELTENEDGTGESVKISPDKDGVVSFDLSSGKAIRPYFGIGWGRVASIKSRISFSFDLGVQKTGGLTLDAYHWDNLNLKMVSNPITGKVLPADIKNEEAPLIGGTVGELVDKIGSGEVLGGFIPVLRFGINIRLF